MMAKISVDSWKVLPLWKKKQFLTVKFVKKGAYFQGF